MIKLITTDSQFNLIPILIKELKGKVNLLDGKNLIFSEEKISLMLERSIALEYAGSFNTAVYSFGNYLRSNRNLSRALTKEGSAMAVKRVLSSVSLSCFKASKTTLAPALYDLIIQLKSAKVKPSDLASASELSFGTLKNKLRDIASVYQGYEEFIENAKLDDQSSMLNYLPELISNDQQIKTADVYILGFNGFTSQIRSAISALLRYAKSVTAILVEGENELAYVNETPDSFRALVAQNNLTLCEVKEFSDRNKESEIIARNLFNPCATNKSKFNTDKIFALKAENKMFEVERVAEIIREKVKSGQCRYRDITVAVPSAETYAEDIERAFTMLEIPYFLDQKKKVGAHPLIRLILSYVDATRKNLEKSALSAFYKNPLFCADKHLSDEFENYTLCYNIDFSRIKTPFTFENKGELSLEGLNGFREKIVGCFGAFNPRKLLSGLEVEKKIKDYSAVLGRLGEMEERAVNEQIYSAVERILNEMDMMLGGMELSLVEFRNVFLSGVSAMEISIIPQYSDAVFVGGLKETALAKAKYLFVLGLTSEVPAVKEDVALLSDGDISRLEEVKVLVEPKIKVVNHRAREHTALALSAFERELYLSYPLVGVGGDKTVKSEVLTFVEDNFTLRPFPKYKGYQSYKQGLSAFARASGDFATGKLDDFTPASSFYSAVNVAELDKLLERANKQIKIRLENSREIMAKSHISPTRIEDYYKCPYRAFLASGLRLKRREEGVVDGFSVGNIMHEIFSEYMLKINDVSDKASSDALAQSIAEKVLKNKNYASYLDDAVTLNAVNNAVDECAKFCYKNYLAYKNSSFRISKTEASFGDGKDCDYPAIELDGGKVKMVGKIDRVDESGEYYRILDYKTVSPSADLDLLFTGKKLQLYLYAKAVSQKLKDSKLAGVYYMPVSDKFRLEGEKEPALSKGLTLSDKGAIEMQDKLAYTEDGLFLAQKKKGEEISIEGEVSGEGLNAMVEYALELSQMAVKRMGEGIIAPTPCDERICSYCEFSSLCPLSDIEIRKHGKVDATTIIDSIKGEEPCPN